MKLIISDGYGRKSAYAATIKNAQKIFEAHLENLDNEISEIAENKEMYFISVNYILKVLSKILDLPEGENIAILQSFWYGKAPKEGEDKREKALNRKEWKEEIAMMMISNNLTRNNLNEGYMSSDNYHLLENLSFMKEISLKRNKKVKYISNDDTFEAASNYGKIIRNVWREDAEEYQVAKFILNFVNNYLIDKYQENYEIVDFQEEY